MRYLFRCSVVGLLLVMVSPLSFPQLASARPSAAAKGCPTLNVLLLIDQSQSLQTTDPANLRVDGAKSLIKSLSNSAEASDDTINLGIAGFGEAAEFIREIALPDGQPEAASTVEIFSERNGDLNTDYVVALEFAVRYFAQKPGGPPVCNKVVWFTDGAYSIDNLDAPGLSSYTTARDKRTIQTQLGSQICGPLPDGSQLGQPVSSAIRAAGFSVQMIDLRTEGSETPKDRAERGETAPVIDRLLAASAEDPCRVAGGRVEASRASELDTEFFAQGQIALGNFELDCKLLEAGYPAAMVNSLAIQNSGVDETTELLVDGDSKAIGQGFANYSPPNGPVSAGTITVRAGSGHLKSCFADLRAVASAQGVSAVFGKADRSFLNFQINGVGDKADGAGVSDKFAVMSATVNGQAADVVWDAASRSWRVDIIGPLTSPPSVVLTSSAVGWGGPAFAPLSPAVELLNEPPAPQVAWDGPSTVEGKASVAGRLQISPRASTGGTLCVTFGTASSTVESLTVTVAEPKQICHSDSEPFSIPASLTTTSSSNDTAEVKLPYTTTYTPGGSATPITIGDAQDVIFTPISLVKPVDARKVILLSALFFVGSVIISLGMLLALTNRQLRLPDPKTLRSVSVPLEISDGVIRRAVGSEVRAEDFALIQGDRSKYNLPGGVEVRRRTTPNPFTTLSANVVASKGSVGVVPSLSRGIHRRVSVNSTFDNLVVLAMSHAGAMGTATLLAKKGISASIATRSIDEAIEKINSTTSIARNSSAQTGTMGSPDAGDRPSETIHGVEFVPPVPAPPTRSSNPSPTPGGLNPPVSPQAQSPETAQSPTDGFFPTAPRRPS